MKKIMGWFSGKSKKAKIGILITVLVVGFLGYKQFFSSKTSPIFYQTSAATRGTLVISVNSSGQVSNTNSSTITTEASGVVTKVVYKNGDSVNAGDPIAHLDLDLLAKQKESQALASYQNAQNNYQSAQNRLLSLQSTMFTNWDKFKNSAESGTYTNGDGSPNYTARGVADFHILEDNWLVAEADYKNQQNVINQARTALSSSWYSYQQSSSTIYAPITGRLNGLSIVEGSVIAPNTSTSNTGTPTKIGSIISDTTPLLTFNLTEVDIGSIKVGDKATITLDALSGKTFTGKVISVDTVGTTSSGVTVYPTMIQLDSKPDGILSNMSASAAIITNVKDDVVIVPSTAVQIQNGESTVRIMKKGKVSTVTVQTGVSSSTETEIVSGVSEGDLVITGQTGGTASRTTSAVTSPFGIAGFGSARTGTGGTVRTGR